MELSGYSRKFALAKSTLSSEMGTQTPKSDYQPFTSCANLASSLLCFGCCLANDKSIYLRGLRVRGLKEMRIKNLAQRLVHGKCFKILLLLSQRAFPYTVMERGGAT